MSKYTVCLHQEYPLFDFKKEEPYTAIDFDFKRLKTDWWEHLSFSGKKEWQMFVRYVNNANKKLKKLKFEEE